MSELLPAQALNVWAQKGRQETVSRDAQTRPAQASVADGAQEPHLQLKLGLRHDGVKVAKVAQRAGTRARVGVNWVPALEGRQCG